MAEQREENDQNLEQEKKYEVKSEQQEDENGEYFD